MADSASSRQATGKVEAKVEDRKQAASPTPDKLRLSQGGVKSSAPEAKVSKESERKDAAARLAELSRNVDDLKKLQGATSPATPAPTAAAPVPTAAPTVVAAATPPAAPTAPVAAPPAPPPAACRASC